jgi:hypothetical protein
VNGDKRRLMSQARANRFCNPPGFLRVVMRRVRRDFPIPLDQYRQ